MTHSTTPVLGLTTVTYPSGAVISLHTRLPTVAKDATKEQKISAWKETLRVRSNRKNLAKLWDHFHNFTYMFENKVQERDNANDVKPMLLDMHTGAFQFTYEYDNYGEGMTEDAYTLEGYLEQLEKDNILHRQDCRFQVMNTRGRIDASKEENYTGDFFSWSDAWKDAKAAIAANYVAIKENDELAMVIKGELRALSSEASPWLTPYMTSDIAGPGSVAPEGYEIEHDPDLSGYDCKSNLMVSKSFTPKKALVDPVTGKVAGVVRRKGSVTVRKSA